MKSNQLITLALCCFSLGQVTAVDAQTTLNGGEWDNPAISSVNREPAHTLEIPFASVQDATSKDITQSSYYLNLDGVWKFKWAPNPSVKPEGFEAVDFDDAGWDDIDVPAVWQIYGLRHKKSWDKPLYVNISYPFSFDSNFSVMATRPGWFTYSGTMTNPVGSYRRTFNVPANWSGRRMYLRFNGAGHGYYVYLNGHQVGYAEDSYLPSEFDVTPYIQSGENVLAVQIYRFTSGSFLECQDYWRLTGISRDVFLWSAPQTQIRDFFWRTDLDDSYTDATATLDVSVDHQSTDDLSGYTLKAQVLDGGQVIAEQSLSAPVNGKNTLTLQAVAPKLWTAETPNLYDLVITLNDGTEDVDIRSTKVGFREVSIARNGSVLINGKRILFRGVNRHDFSEEGGRAVTREEMEKDVMFMKRLNMNAVRTSHYPNNPYWYELCDKYGLYMIAEADVECHGNNNLSSELAFRHAFVERNERNVQTFKNHPAIVIWSMGNECGGGDNFKYVSEAIHAIDQTRLRHYEANDTWSDIESAMYWDVEGVENVGKRELTRFQSGGQARPFVQQENSHAMGNAMGNMKEYWEVYEKYPALAGEFIWDWKDQGLRLPEKDGKYGNLKIPYWAYGGDFGDSPNDGNFCTNGVIFADYSESAKSDQVWKMYQPFTFSFANNSVTVTNRLAFKGTEDYQVNYSVLRDGQVVETRPLDVVLAGGESKTIYLGNLVPAGVDEAAEYAVRFSATQRTATPWAEAGYEVASEQVQLNTPVKQPYATTVKGQPTVTESSTKITLSGNNFSVEFNRYNGTIMGYSVGGKKVLNSPLALNVFRIPTDNDHSHAGEWDRMSLRNLTIKSGTFTVDKESNPDAVILSIDNKYVGTDITFDVAMDFYVYADGVVQVMSSINPSTQGVVLPRVGFTTEMPAGFTDMRWYGRGPGDTYADRKEGGYPGVWHSTPAEQFTHFVKPQEMGNKEETRWMSICNADGQGLLFVAPQMMAASAKNWRDAANYTSSSDRMKHAAEMKFVNKTIVNLDAQMRGLGNNSCGPDVRNPYELKSDVRQFGFMIMPLAESATDSALAVRAHADFSACMAPAITRVTSTGRIQIKSNTSGSTIMYRVNGGEWKKYITTFALNDGGIVEAYAKKDGLLDSRYVMTTFGIYVDRSDWKVVSCDSYQGGNEPKYAIDGNASTIWHTPWGYNEPTHPHEIVVDMKKEYIVNAFTYLARPDGENGMIKDYELYFSMDNMTWTKVASGSFDKKHEVQRVNLASPVTARYFKLIALSEVNGKNWTSAAELNIESSATTDINDVIMTAEQIRSGHDMVYDMCGHRVDNPANGVFVVNGKKVIFK